MRSFVLPFSFRRTSLALTGVVALLSVTAGACSLLVSFDKGSGTAGTAGSAGSMIGVCSIDDDCLPAGQEQNACFVAKCIGAECTTSAKPDGTDLPASAQIPGDCLKKICMGNKPVDQPDPMDSGDDGNPCTVETCNGTMPVTMNAPANTSCGGPGLVCDGMGKCKGCKMDSDCPAGTPCSGFVCDTQQQECNDAPVMAGTVLPMADQMAGDCVVLVCDGNGDSMPMNDDTDVPAPSADCLTATCAGGMPMEGPSMAGAACMTTRACDAKGNCLGGACMTAADCPAGSGATCVDGVCCDTACAGACQACTAAKKGSGLDGACGPIKAGTDPDNECAANCDGAGACGKGPLGAACAAAADCTSNFCVDGVCCDKACAGLCEACTATIQGQGADGTCGPIKAATDPENECAGAMNCDGAGMCL